MYLEKINCPNDIKYLSIDQLNILAQEIREALFNRLSKIGGHLGSNLGIVELTIALHYVFSFPNDKIVFDVSHQCYTHKILTGRKDGFLFEEHFKDVSGYTNYEESIYDLFKVGHTSTSISLASGLVKARDILNHHENVIAIIGDGSLSGGEALEGLNFVGSEIKSNFIIVVNDNEQSIAENHGGLYQNLKNLRNNSSQNNIFKAFNLDYIYLEEGNNLEKLISLFKKMKDINHPIVVHIHTQKGKGYHLAELNKEKWHYTKPFNQETGELINDVKLTYPSITANYLINKVKQDPKIVVVTAGVPLAIGLDQEKRNLLGQNYIDVGIAEEHAIALISGLAKNGCKPIFGTNATFLQRTYDQISQDLCLNNSPATIVIGNTSLISLNDVTHLGIFSISAFKNIPNLVLLAPTDKNEYLAMLDYSLNQNKHPTLILMPANKIIENTHNNIDFLSYEITQKGEKVCIIAEGNFYYLGLEATKLIEKELHFKPTLINPRILTHLDEKTLSSLKENHQLIITIEDGVIDGGFGEDIANYFSLTNMKVKTFGLHKKFIDRFNCNDILFQEGITSSQIKEFVKKEIQ